MRKSYRRYEILLPRWSNEHQPITDEAIGETLLELRKRFGAVSSETQIIRGLWEHLGQIFSDDLIRIFVDVADTDENHQFFEQFKERLKTRFAQIDIWMTTHLIEVI